MNSSACIRFLASLLPLLIGAAPAYSDENHLASCRSFYHGLSDLKLQRPPERVLLVPLLSKDPHTNESPRWSEQPARHLEAFYRKRFRSTVLQLHDVWSWNDYYRQADQMALQTPPFDRVIFVSHGGFDGPVLKNAIFWQDLNITDGKGKLLQWSEAQPGLKNIVSISYDTEKNDVFSNYMASHWQELAPIKSSDVWHLLKELEKQIQPLDQACYQRYCSPVKLAESPDRLREYRSNLCELICRESLFELKTSVELSPERFFRFAKSLRSLVTENGVIFFGACNPGSAAPEKTLEPDTTEYLTRSTLAGGPHMSYVHLINAATDRITAGPIGNSSAEDIVNRIMMFETGRPQRNLCIAAPAKK